MDLLEQYETYKKRYRQYKNKREKLNTAYEQIKTVKDMHATGGKKLNQCMKGAKWKGQQSIKFNGMVEELAAEIERHRKKIDSIHDAINDERNAAKDKMLRYDSLVGDIWTELQNLTNG